MSFSVRGLLILFSVCLNIGFIGFAGYAVMERKMPEKGPGRFADLPERVIGEMGLSPEKEREMMQIIDHHMAEMDELRARVREKKLSLLELFGKEVQPDTADISAYKKEIIAMEMERENMKFRHQEHIRRVLKPHQARQFFSILSRHIKQRHEAFRNASNRRQ